MRIFDGVESPQSFFSTPINRLGEPICTGAGGDPFRIEMWSPLSNKMIDFQIQVQDDTDLKSLKVRQRLRAANLDAEELRARFVDELLSYAVETREEEITAAIKGWENFPRCIDPETGQPFEDGKGPDTTCNAATIAAFMADNPFIIRQLKTAYNSEKNSLSASKRRSPSSLSDTPSANADSISPNPTGSPGASTSGPSIH